MTVEFSCRGQQSMEVKDLDPKTLVATLKILSIYENKTLFINDRGNKPIVSALALDVREEDIQEDKKYETEDGSVIIWKRGEGLPSSGLPIDKDWSIIITE